MAKRKKVATAVLAAYCAMVPLAVYAQEATDAQKEFALPETVVTATRTEQNVKDTPSTVQVITREQIELRQAQTLGDVLKEAVGVMVFSDFQGRSQLKIRGSESRHVLILIDGRRVSGELSFNSANAYDIDRIRMDNVERVEIIRGPAGALYGSDAMGGVINIITKKPTKNEGRLVYEFAGWDGMDKASQDMQFYYQGVNDDGKFSWNVSAGQQKPQAYRLMDHGVNTSANYYGKEQPIALSGTWNFDNGRHLRMDYSKLWEDTGMDSLFAMQMGTLITGPKAVKNDNTRTDWSLEYGGQDDKGDWQVRAYRSVYDKDYLSYYTYKPPGMAPQAYKANFDVVNRTISVLEGRDSWKVGDKQRMTAGFEWRKDESEGTRILNPDSTGKSVTHWSPWAGITGQPATLTKNSYDAALEYRALYVQDEINSGEKLLLIPSLRYDWSDKFSSETTPRLGITYKAQENVRVKAVIGKGYKTPTINELYHNFEMYPGSAMSYGQFFVGNPDLKPEKSTDYELSLEKDWNKTTGRVALFRNNVKDRIEAYKIGQEPAGGAHNTPTPDEIMTYRNIDRATLQGFEGEVSHKLNDAVKLRLGYVYLDAQNDTANIRLLDTARHQINVGVTYLPPQSKWSFSLDAVTLLDYLTQDEPQVMTNKAQGNQSYSIVNVMAQKSLTNDSTFYFGVNNISDHKDFGHVMLGRTYRVGMKYQF